MDPLVLCVTGDAVVGRTQRVKLTPSASLTTTLRRLTQSLELEPADATVTAVSLWDPDFSEYIKVDTFDEVPNKAKLRIQTTVSEAAPVNAGADLVAVLEKSDAAVAALAGELGGASVGAAVAARQDAQRAIITAVASGAMSAADADAALAAEATRPIAAAASTSKPVRAVHVSPVQGLARSPAATQAASRAHDDDGDDDDAPVRRRKAAPPGRKVAAPSAAVPPTPPRQMGAATAAAAESVLTPSRPASSPLRRRESSPTRGGQRPSSPRPVTTARAAAPKLGLGSSSQVTVFCVYNGALAQRAKAIRVDREAPSIELLRRTLLEKFKSELALGYVEIDTGAFVEITESAHLADIIERDCKDTDNLTLQCWRPDGLGDAEEQEESRLSVKTGGQTPARGKGATPRAPSAASVGTRMDVSGVAYSEDQLRDLFDELDVDGSGFLDIDEFRAYFHSQYDDMGINDADTKFEKMVASNPGFDDGQLDFNEFCLVMLKLAQW